MVLFEVGLVLVENAMFITISPVIIIKSNKIIATNQDFLALFIAIPPSKNSVHMRTNCPRGQLAQYRLKF